MVKNNNDIKTKDEKGQALVITFVIMVIFLSFGLTVASKYIKGLRNITQADQSTRALGIAEAAVEHILLIPIETLEEYATNGNCGTDCYLEIEADGINMFATVEISHLGSTSEPFVMEVKQDVTHQVNLLSYPDNQPFYVCWNGSSSSITALYHFGTVGNYETLAYSYNPVGTSNASNGFDMSIPLFGYANCFTIVSRQNSVMLRIKSFYADTNLVVIPAAGLSLPSQGISIISTGHVGTARRKVSVLITDPFVPSVFDYALFQKSPDDSLSN